MSLLDGTYTVGIYGYWEGAVEEEGFRDMGDATKDSLSGATTTLEAREVVSDANCDQCDQRARALRSAYLGPPVSSASS